jgi:hypothetical protein
VQLAPVSKGQDMDSEEMAIAALEKIAALDAEGLILFPQYSGLSPQEFAERHSLEYMKLCVAILHAKKALVDIEAYRQDNN